MSLGNSPVGSNDNDFSCMSGVNNEEMEGSYWKDKIWPLDRTVVRRKEQREACR